MTLAKTVRLEDFSGGINLATGPLDPKYAIDCLDVLYGRSIATRPGWAYLTSTASTFTCLKPYYTTAGAARILGGRSGNTDAINSSGTATHTVAKTSTDATMFGGPSAEAAYLANGSDTVFKYTDGAGFSAPGAAMPKARYLAVQSPDNRLVATGFTAGANGPGGSTVSESHVHFSDERAPETWTSTSNVQLDPGDGQKVQGCTSWRNLVFVWKEKHFYVFGGNSTDEAGLPIFNREKRTGAGLAAPQGYAKGPDAMYWIARDGIYTSTGGNASKISAAIDPIFGDIVPSFWSHGVVNQSQIANASATFWNGRLYVSVPMNGSSTNNRILVWDSTYDYWSIYSIPAASLTTWNPADKTEIAFAHATSKIGRHSQSYTQDSTTDIAAYSRSAWIDLQEVVSLREAKLWGTGRITVQAAVDYDTDSGTGQTTALGTAASTWGGSTWGGTYWEPRAGAYDKAMLRGFGVRGVLFSITFLGGGTNPLKLEQASCTFNGGRQKE